MKWILALGIALCSSPGFASPHDIFSSDRPAIWRSSRTANAENFVLLATGSIHIHSIIVESPTVTVDSFYSLYNETSPATATFNFNIVTGAFLTTSVSGGMNGAFPQPIDYDIMFPSGCVINKIGIATINLLWDYIYQPQKEKIWTDLNVPFRP